VATRLAEYGGIEIPVSGGRRSDLPAGHPSFPLGDSPDIRNVLLHEGRLRKWPGRVAFTSAVLGGSTPVPVRGLWRFSLASGNQFLLATDGRDIWKHNTTGPTWDLLTPLYTTGTAAFTHNSAAVVGTATSWDANNCKAGMKIKLNADGVYAEVLSLDVGSQTITLTAIYSGAGGGAGAYTLRQRRSAAGARWMRAAIGSDQIVLVNGVDAPLTWDGALSTFLELAGSPPVCRFVTTFHQRNLLVMARDQNSPLRLQNSDAADYAEWTLNLAESYDFEESTAPITGVDGGHEYLYLFRENGIWRGFWEGFGVGISWTQVPGIDGPVYPNTLVRLGGEAQTGGEAPVAKWAYLGQGNVHGFDGDRIDPIGDAVRALIFDSIDPAYPDSAVGNVIPEWGLAIWSWPTIGSAGIPTDSIAYDYKRNLWFPRTAGFSAFGAYDLTAGDVTWDSLVGSIDSQSRIFDAINVAPQGVCLVGDETGHVWYLAWLVNDAGAAISAQRSTPIVALDKQASCYEVGAVEFRTTAPAGSQFAVTVLGGERPEDVSQLQQVIVTVSSSGPCIAYLRCAARYLQVRIDNEELNGEYGLYDLRVRARAL